MVLSKNAMALIAAYKDGYRVIDNQVISLHTGKTLILTSCPGGYPKFSYRLKSLRYKTMV